MNKLDEKDIADSLYQALLDNSNYSVRAEQDRRFQVGISSLGFCSERVRRMLDQQTPEDTDHLAAWIGTALGDHLEKVAADLWPTAIIQSEVTVRLEGDGGTYMITGHPDVILPDEGILIDNKTTFGLRGVERKGPDQQQQIQRNLYALGAWEAGMFGDLPLEEVRVANIWLDRAAIDKRLHVQMEPFDPTIVDQATLWLDDVVYAYLHGESARKEPPRSMCFEVCGFAPECRGDDTDVQGLITDKSLLTAVDMWREGTTLEREGKKLKTEAKHALIGVKGSTGEFTVRWVYKAGGHVSYDRAGGNSLEIKPLGKGRVRGV